MRLELDERLNRLLFISALLSLYFKSLMSFSSLSESYTDNSFNLCCQTLADSEVLSRRKYILLSLSVWLESTSVLKLAADLSRCWDSALLLKVFYIFILSVSSIERLFSVLVNEFWTVSISVAVSIWFLLIYCFTQQSKILSIAFCQFLNWSNHVLLICCYMTDRCSN